VTRADFWHAELRAAQTARNFGISSLPVDPFAIADREGILCEQVDSPSLGVSGCLMKSGDNFGIFYSGEFPNEGFLRFTVAHELGHYFLDGHCEHFFAAGNAEHWSGWGFESEERYEREADTFAAALLMPEDLLRSSRAWNFSGLKAIESLANECVTSLTATAIRYVRLSRDPVAVICSMRDRVQFAFMSQALKDVPFLGWIKKGSLLPENTATVRFNRDQSNVARACRSTSTSRMETWFDGGGNLELVEEIVGLGGYGRTLTVLWPESMPDSEELEEEEEDSEDILPSDRWR
jgi:hypothetical protein